MSNRRPAKCPHVCSPTSVCGQMTQRDWSRMAMHGRATETPKGSVLPFENEWGPALMIVCAGTIALQHHLSDGRRSLSELFMKGDIIDYRRQSRRFQGDIVALNHAWTYGFQSEAFEDVCGSNPRVNLTYNTRLREQAHILRDHCVDIGKKTPPERIASFLFEQLNRSNRPVRGTRTFRIELPHAEVGDYLALQPETVSRSLSRLSREGIISVRRGGRVTISNEARLRLIANGGMPRRAKGTKNITKLRA